ncbi:MAG: hypothetical protein VR75_12480 [Hyphomonadaceae bacterium BRH_c29]|nr:MAG: hypothetical protein VR75_12480 [Hyphomonadaceae bacterium BRH_c29]
MSTLTPFGACVEHLRLSYAELADILSEGSGIPYSPHRAKMVCDGREPVPPFAWSALRLLNTQLDYYSDQLLQLHQQGGNDRFIVSMDDLRSMQLSRVLVRTILNLRGGVPVQLVDLPGPTFGFPGMS